MKKSSSSKAIKVATTLFLLGALFGVLISVAVEIVSNIASPTEQATENVTIFITATPSPTPQIDSQYVANIGNPITISVNWRLNNGVGISYFDGQNLVETLFCRPTPANGICEVTRPPLLTIYKDSFAIIAWSSEGKYVIPANVDKQYIYITYGWEQRNGYTIEKFFEE